MIAILDPKHSHQLKSTHVLTFKRKERMLGQYLGQRITSSQITLACLQIDPSETL